MFALQYEGCSKRFFDNRDVPTLLYIAKAYYHLGRDDKDVDMIIKCLKYLEKVGFFFFFFSDYFPTTPTTS